MKAAIYARVSTEEQTVENQLPVLEQFARTRGWEISQVYSENVSAWKAGHQTEFSRLLHDARNGRFQIVLVWSLDRVTREGIGTLMQIYNRLNQLNVRLVSIQESFTEFPTEFTPLFLAMIGFFAKWESDRRSERTKAGYARPGAKRRGPDKKKRKRRWWRKPAPGIVY
jgi:DNA invertase Pin-like site-specific DNA recombinase